MITKNYIKMCERAKEIQCDRILGRYDFGDIYYLKSGHKHGGKFRFIGSYDGYDCDKELIEKSIWLPTQEQLQEMLTMDTEYAKEYNKKEGAIFCGFYIFLDMMDWVRNCLKKPTTINCNSMNEMWLIFVMSEKYSKIWTGEKWVKAR